MIRAERAQKTLEEPQARSIDQSSTNISSTVAKSLPPTASSKTTDTRPNANLPHRRIPAAKKELEQWTQTIEDEKQKLFDYNRQPKSSNRRIQNMVEIIDRRRKTLSERVRRFDDFPGELDDDQSNDDSNSDTFSQDNGWF